MNIKKLYVAQDGTICNSLYEWFNYEWRNFFPGVVCFNCVGKQVSDIFQADIVRVHNEAERDFLEAFVFDRSPDLSYYDSNFYEDETDGFVLLDEGEFVHGTDICDSIRFSDWLWIDEEDFQTELLQYVGEEEYRALWKEYLELMAEGEEEDE